MDDYSSGVYPQLTLRDYWRVIFRHKWVVFISVLVVAITVYFGLQMRTPVYKATVKMLVSSVKETQAPYSRDIAGYSQNEAALTQSEIVKSLPVVERAVKAVHLDKRPMDNEKLFSSNLRQKMIAVETKEFKERLKNLPVAQQDYIYFRRAVESLQGRLIVEPVRGTNLLLISVVDFDPLVAAMLANVVSRSYVIFDLEQKLAESATKYGELHPTVTLLKGHVEKMTSTLNGEPLDNIEAIGPATVKIISQAAIPTKPEGRSKKIYFALAVFLSAVLGVVMAFIFEYLDPTVRSAADLSSIVQVPLLSAVPRQFGKKRRILNDKNVSSPAYIAAFHELACQIRFFLTQKKMRVFLFTAPDTAQGTTTVVSNLALCLVKDFKKRVLVIDAHYRRSAIHNNFSLAGAPGLVDVLAQKLPLSKVCCEVAPNFWMVPAGDMSLDLECLLDSPKMAEIIEEAKNAFDVVLIDCADLRHYRDAISIGQFSDGIVLVIAEGKTRRPAIATAISPLKENNFNLAGVVLNNRTFSLPKFIYDRV